MSALGRLSQLEGSSLNDKPSPGDPNAGHRKIAEGAIANKLEIDHTHPSPLAAKRNLPPRARQAPPPALVSRPPIACAALVHPSLDVLEQELRKGYYCADICAANAVLRHANLRKSTPLDACEPDIDEEMEE